MGKKHYVIYTPEMESRQMAELAFQYAPLQEEWQLADLSCGNGNLLTAFLKYSRERKKKTGVKYYGYDIDEKAIVEAKERLTEEESFFFCEDSLGLKTE